MSTKNKYEKIWVRSNKKKSVFRVTRPYLNLLVKSRIFFRFSGKYIILCILKGRCLSKCIKLYFPLKKCTCRPYLKFSDPLPKTHFYPHYLFNSTGNDIINRPEADLKSTETHRHPEGQGQSVQRSNSSTSLIESLSVDTDEITESGSKPSDRETYETDDIGTGSDKGSLDSSPKDRDSCDLLTCSNRVFTAFRPWTVKGSYLL